MAKKTKITVEDTKSSDVKPQKARFKIWFERHKRLAIVSGIVLFLVVAAGVIYALPTVRYVALSPFVTREYSVKVVDETTRTPLVDVEVTLGEKSAQRTNVKGVAKFTDVAVGYHEVSTKLPLYDTEKTTVEVPVFGEQTQKLKLHANGKRVTVKVVDRLSGEAIDGAEIEAGDSTAVTRDGGKSQVVVPTSAKKPIAMNVVADGYLAAKTEVFDKTVEVQLVKEGRMYFLSKQSGTIDVVSTNFDGSNRQVVVPGTGSEQDYSTSLFASRDWRYLALKSQRDTKNPSLYLIDTQRPDLVRVVNGDEKSVDSVGWSGHRFIYEEYGISQFGGADYSNWQLKSVMAANHTTVILDKKSEATTAFAAPASDQIGLVYILEGDTIVYAKEWGGDQYGGEVVDQQAGVMAVQADGGAKRWLKFYSSGEIGYIETKLYKPQEIHYRVNNMDGSHRENLMTVNKKIELVPPAQQKFDQDYPTFLISPNGSRSLWSEPRDGKFAIFVGDSNSGDKQQLVNLSEYSAYGWMTDKYLLLQKNNSELYITTEAQLKKGAGPLKVSDYHRVSVPGYGYGYGGQ